MPVNERKIVMLRGFHWDTPEEVILRVVREHYGEQTTPECGIISMTVPKGRGSMLKITMGTNDQAWVLVKYVAAHRVTVSAKVPGSASSDLVPQRLYAQFEKSEEESAISTVVGKAARACHLLRELNLGLNISKVEPIYTKNTDTPGRIFIHFPDKDSIKAVDIKGCDKSADIQWCKTNLFAVGVNQTMLTAVEERL